MKTPLFLALLLAAGAALAWIGLTSPEPDYEAPRTVPEHLAGAVPAGYVVRTFEVEGMCCESCPPRMQEAALAVAGVRGVAARLGEGAVGEVEVLAPEGLDPSALAHALTFDRYHASPASVPGAP